MLLFFYRCDLGRWRDTGFVAQCGNGRCSGGGGGGNGLAMHGSASCAAARLLRRHSVSRGRDHQRTAWAPPAPLASGPGAFNPNSWPLMLSMAFIIREIAHDISIQLYKLTFRCKQSTARAGCNRVHGAVLCYATRTTAGRQVYPPGRAPTEHASVATSQVAAAYAARCRHRRQALWRCLQHDRRA